MTTWKHLLVKTICFSCFEKNDSKYTIVGIPLDQTYTYRSGSKYAPDYIRRISCELEFYSYLSSVSLEYLGYKDYGNILISPGDLGKSFENIKRVVRGIVEETSSDRKFFIIGGEHLITYPVFKVLGNEVDQLIVFDAHLDMRDSYMESEYNHSTVLRRIFEEYSIPVIYIGARSFSSEEIDFADRNRDLVKICTPMDIEKDNCSIDRLGNIYISIDMDVLDPVYAPGVSNPEPIGLTLLQFLKYIYRVVSSSSKVIAIDLVEVNPLFDSSEITGVNAAKILFELTGLFEKTK